MTSIFGGEQKANIVSRLDTISSLRSCFMEKVKAKRENVQMRVQKKDW